MYKFANSQWFLFCLTNHTPPLLAYLFHKFLTVREGPGLLGLLSGRVDQRAQLNL